jgi:hypothetical protein
LTTEGRQYIDWTADYRMYSQERIDCAEVFGQITKEVQTLNANPVLITALDDSLLRKSGKKIPGVKLPVTPWDRHFRLILSEGRE